MADLYGPEQRARSLAAERSLRNALRIAPGDRELRRAMLDLYYDRVVAEAALAKDRRIEATKARLLPPTSIETVLDQEIATLEAALGVEGQPGGFRYALASYFELLNDGFGIDVALFDPQLAGARFGYYMLSEELPSRSLRAATYLEGGVPTPVTPPDAQPGSTPPTLYDGYKDLVLVYDVMADYAEIARELALRYVTRDQPGDEQAALDLIAESQRKLYVEGGILQNLLPEGGAPEGSGLDPAISRWRRSLGQLGALRDTALGDLNPLGYDDDFLMLVVNDNPEDPTTFGAFRGPRRHQDPTSALRLRVGRRRLRQLPRE